MAGSLARDDVVAYLSRLLGEPISPEQPIRLRSVHRAALSSWARKQTFSLNAGVLASGKPFVVGELLADGQDHTPARAQAALPGRALATSSGAGIGIDIEDVDALPASDDYREHPFFAENFTPSEISYCLRQADPRASLCGLWAAKEAVLKSGYASLADGNLRDIEISHDLQGRPVMAGCMLSISHTAKMAVAVCVPEKTAAHIPAKAPVMTAPPDASPQPDLAGRRSRRTGAAGAVMALVAAVALIGSAWRAWAVLH